MSPRPLRFDPVLRAERLWREQIGAAEAMAAVTSVMRVHQILSGVVDEALRPTGLTFARFEVLALLHFAQHHRLPMHTVGERLQVHPTSVTHAVDRLEDQGLVKRIPHPTDRRTTLVELTASGEDVRAAATTSVVRIGFGLCGLTARQAETLTWLLAKVRRAAGDFVPTEAP